MILLEDIENFEDIKFEPHPSETKGVRALVDLGDSELSIVGGGGFYGDGVISFEVAFIDKETGRITAPSNFLDLKNDKLNIPRIGKNYYEDEPISYIGRESIMSIIKSKKESPKPNEKPIESSLKKISDKLIELAFLDKEERKNGLIDLQADLDVTDEKIKLVADILLGISSGGEKPNKIQTKIKTKTKPQIENFESLMDEELDFCSLIDDCLLD